MRADAIGWLIGMMDAGTAVSERGMDLISMGDYYSRSEEICRWISESIEFKGSINACT